MPNFEGVFPIVITPFQEDGQIDLVSQQRVVQFLIESGAHGLGLLANASEGYALSSDERAALVREIIKTVDGKVPVIVSTGHSGTDVAVALSRQAEEAGADGVMVAPPFYVRPEADGVFEYYRAISDAIRIPLMVQDAPLLTQVTLAAPLLDCMARKLEQVRYVKVEAPPTGPKITQILELAGDSLVLFGGLNGQFLPEELGRGARGTMPGSDMIPDFVALWNLFRKGCQREARTVFNRILPLMRYELQPGLGVSVMKHNLKTAGIIASARVRHPTRSLDAEGLREVRELLEHMGVKAGQSGFPIVTQA